MRQTKLTIQLKKNKGSALTWALIVLMLVIMIGSVYIKSTNNDIYANQALQNKIVLKYIVEAGINEGLLALSVGEEFPIAGAVQNISGEYTVNYDGKSTLISTATYKNKTYTLEVIIDENNKIVSWREIY